MHYMTEYFSVKVLFICTIKKEMVLIVALLLEGFRTLINSSCSNSGEQTINTLGYNPCSDLIYTSSL